MRAIPLNLMTLYADLEQRLVSQEVRPGSISIRRIDGKKYLYAVERDGQMREQRFLGPADAPEALAEAERIRRAENEAKQTRATVSALKSGRIPSPPLQIGRIFQVLANADLFERGMTLVGTAAYRLYPCLVGHFLSNAAITTNDLDISVASFVGGDDVLDLEKILKRADPSFAAHWSRDDKLPKVFKSKDGFAVEILTRHARGRSSPVLVKDLTCAAEALSYQEYLAEDTVEVAALYGPGVLVRVPSPTRYAIHKLIVAQQRKRLDPKKQKDLRQASELIDILIEVDDAAFQDELDAARKRGKAWKSPINASLEEIGRDIRQGHLPLARPENLGRPMPRPVRRR